MQSPERSRQMPDWATSDQRLKKTPTSRLLADKGICGKITGIRIYPLLPADNLGKLKALVGGYAVCPDLEAIYIRRQLSIDCVLACAVFVLINERYASYTENIETPGGTERRRKSFDGKRPRTEKTRRPGSRGTGQQRLRAT
ncbi:hypothetical protein T12_13757 [Trichinella patagoniensis]|uniref:Uncharacterized protein n=1 Tax=Trichinella patagoniensis TaxID=990121 RepID=A0A0V0Z3H6_9BILA|nr:hypothetical protein T12_13757 [Trichinella patagoniensis]